MAFEHALYRLKVAQGFLSEGRQDVELNRWRSAADNEQLAVPVGKTHNPAPQLREALARGLFPEALAKKVERLAECVERLGFDVHIQADYGDETGGLTPWDLFGEEDASQALNQAEEAARLAEAIVQEVQTE